MLDELTVRDYALIQEASLSFAPGCTVLTGETGAGKTALIGAIKLLIGERGDTGAVRTTAEELRVEAHFVFADTQADADREYVVSRRLRTDGRSRCTLNDQMVTVNALAQTIGPLVDLHGQHDHQALLSAAVQLNYLDHAAGSSGARALSAWQKAWDARQQAAAAASEVEIAAQASEQSLQNARFALKEIEAISPEQGEWQELEASLPILRHGEDLACASNEALALLRNEGGALEQIAQAQQLLSRQAGVDTRLDTLSAELTDLMITAEDLTTTLRVYRESVDFDPEALQQALDRMGELEGLRRRFGPSIENVFVTWQNAAEQLETVGNLVERRADAERELARTEQDLQDASVNLAKVRAQTAKTMASELTASLQDLAMEGSSLSFSITDLPRETWTRHGSAHYELLFRPAPASGLRPLAKIASGGELSRVMLAIKSLEYQASEHVTLVFDEIDAGIGGATATAVAERLKALAAKHQVIVVTHLAQIAAIASSHFVVEKQTIQGEAQTSIKEVRGDQRIAEIARMLAGSTDAAALDHARQLLLEA
jgi:DNA repair protein RecN (Recombination protein N)